MEERHVKSRAPFTKIHSPRYFAPEFGAFSNSCTRTTAARFHSEFHCGAEAVLLALGSDNHSHGCLAEPSATSSRLARHPRGLRRSPAYRLGSELIVIHQCPGSVSICDLPSTTHWTNSRYLPTSVQKRGRKGGRRALITPFHSFKTGKAGVQQCRKS